MAAYYNENDPYAVQWLRNLIDRGLIAHGDVDERSIADVRPGDLRGYDQCHFFAGIGGWSYALWLAGFPDDRPVWTGSCPCQPFSAAGEGKAADDERHLWPAWFSLIHECRPAIVFGEQVEAAIGWGWLDAVFADLETQGYACGAAVLPACSVGAPHIRNRLWFVADHQSERRSSWRPSEAPRRPAIEPVGYGHDRQQLADGIGPRLEIERQQSARDQCAAVERGGETGELGNAASDAERQSRIAKAGDGRSGAIGGSGPWGAWALDRQYADSVHDHGSKSRSPWRDCDWLPCTDGKARPTQSGIFPLAHGVPHRVAKLRAAGNAIVPQVAAEFIKAAS